MKPSHRLIIAAILVILPAALAGCIANLRSAKPDTTEPKVAKKEPPLVPVRPREISPDTGKDVQQLSPKTGEQEASTGKQESRSPEDEKSRRLYEPPPPPPDMGKKGSIDLREREDVNAAALDFAKNTKGVKHVKTCYSRLYGGWYLMLYVEKGKNMALHQYSWDESNKEWAISYVLKELPQDQIEYHLKSEIADEKCFLLK